MDINFAPGVTFPINSPIAVPRDIPVGQIAKTTFFTEKDAQGNFWFAIRMQIPAGVVHPTAFTIDSGTFNTLGYFPLTNAATGELNISNVSHALAQQGNIVTVNLNFDVTNGKIGGAGV